MIRFIIRRKWRDAASGAESDGFETLVCEAPELERVLRGGGCGESGFDIRELAGAEIEQPATQPPAVGVDDLHAEIEVLRRAVRTGISVITESCAPRGNPDIDDAGEISAALHDMRAVLPDPLADLEAQP